MHPIFFEIFIDNQYIISSSDPIHLIPESTVLFTKGTAYTVSFVVCLFFYCLHHLEEQIFLKLFLLKPF